MQFLTPLSRCSSPRAWSRLVTLLLAVSPLLLAVEARGGDGGGRGGDDDRNGGDDDRRGGGGGAAPSASAAAGGGGGGGSNAAASTFTFSMNGKNLALSNGGGQSLNTPVTGPLLARGKHVQFDFDPQSFGVMNFMLTGASDPQRLVTQPTTIFASQNPTSLSPSQMTNPRLTRLVIDDDNLTATISSDVGSIKVQASDQPQGSVLEIEPEFSGNLSVEFTRTLAGGLFYFDNDNTHDVNFGNGVDADSTHQMLIGMDSPERAANTFQDGMATKFLVQSGGHVAIVLGQNAVNAGSPSAAICDSHCQDQDKIQGAVSVAPSPNVTPFSAGTAAAFTTSDDDRRGRGGSASLTGTSDDDMFSTAKSSDDRFRSSTATSFTTVTADDRLTRTASGVMPTPTQGGATLSPQTFGNSAEGKVVSQNAAGTTVLLILVIMTLFWCQVFLD